MNEIILLDEIGFKYNDKEIFKKLSYNFCEGRYTIQGENGVGKSTLMNLLFGYLEPNTGIIKRKQNRLFRGDGGLKIPSTPVFIRLSDI